MTDRDQAIAFALAADRADRLKRRVLLFWGYVALVVIAAFVWFCRALLADLDRIANRPVEHIYLNGTQVRDHRTLGVLPPMEDRK